jgi:arylsulfatase A-like enzyme
VASRVDQLDVAPTVLELAGLAPPRGLPGRSLAPTLAGGAPPAEVPSPAWLERLHWHQESLVDGDYKLIRNLRPRRSLALVDELLYDLARDAVEQRPMLTGREARTGFLRAQLRFWTARSGPSLQGGDAQVDEELRRELEALGYLN